MYTCFLLFFASYPFILAFLFNFIKNNGLYPELSFTFDKLGVFGDLFGSLNSIFSFLAFSGIVASVFYQRKELEENRVVLRKQNFEYYFFQELSRLREVRNSIFIKGEFSYEFEIDNKQFILKEARDSWGDHALYILNEKCNEWFFYITKDKKHNYSQYQKLYDKFLYKILGGYYRVLYNIIKNIDLAEGLDESEKRRYVHLVRAELSNSELFFLLHNGLSDHGANFKPFLEKYEMFEHYHDQKTSITLLIQYEESAFGSNEKLKKKYNTHKHAVDNNPNKKK